MLRNLPLAVILLTVTSLAQLPAPTSFSFPLSFSLSGYDVHNYDMVANELGIHVVYPSGSSIVHDLYGFRGQLINRSTVVATVSGEILPAISSHIRNGIEELHVAFRTKDSISIRRSTNGGLTWLIPQSASRLVTSSTASRRIRIASDSDLVNVTWDTGTDQEVLFARYNLGLNPTSWDQFKIVTDENDQQGDSVIVSYGWYPDIAVSEIGGTKRIHIAIINERRIANPECSLFKSGPYEDSLLFQQIVERTAVISGSGLSWQPMDIMQSVPENPCDDSTSQGNFHGEHLTTSPFLHSGNGQIVIAHSSKNYNISKPGDDPEWRLYQYTDGKSVSHRYAVEVDPVLSLGPGLQYHENHAISFNSRDGKFSWVRKFNGDTLWVARHDLDSKIGAMKLSMGAYPKASANVTHANAVVYSAGEMIGFKNPQDILSDVDVNSYYTSKNRISKSFDIYINSGVKSTVYDTLILDSLSTLRVKGTLECRGLIALLNDANLVIESGAKLEMKDGGKLILFNGAGLQCDRGGIIDMLAQNASGDSIIFLDSAYANIDDSLAFRGRGTIVSANITWDSDFFVNDTSDIVFSGGGSLKFNDSPLNHDINVTGKLTFDGSENKYYLKDSLGVIYVSNGGELTTLAGATLSGIPNIQSYSPSYLLSYGIETDSCHWIFRHKAPCDVYGHLQADYTTFQSEGIIDSALSEWLGILVAYSDARINLGHCTIRDIYVDPDSLHGSAIHFYDSPYIENSVGDCLIERLPNPLRPKNDPKGGDGIFLQAGSSYSSLAWCFNNSIYRHWWTGISSFNSISWLNQNTIYCNRRGVGLYNNAQSWFFDNCITRHDYEGIYGINYSNAYLGDSAREGGNAIVQNNLRQIALEIGSGANAGYWMDSVRYGGMNKIYQNINQRHRISLNYGSWASLVYDRIEQPNFCNGNYGYYSPGQLDSLILIQNWGFVNPDSALCFDPLPNSCIIDPCGGGTIAPILNPNQEDDRFPQTGSFQKSTTIPMSLINSFLSAQTHARKREINKALNLVRTIIRQSTNHRIVALAAANAVHWISEYSRKFPDSSQIVYARLINFLQAQYDSASQTDHKAALLKALCHAYYANGDLTNATARVQFLLTQYSGSDYVKFILPLRQLLAMARRDTSEVNRSVYLMQSNGFSSDQLRIAKAMREAFLRVKPREAVSKKGLPQQEGKSRWHIETGGLLAQTRLQPYPNPFNPLTNIEVRLPIATHVEIEICNMLGMEIHSLIDANFTKGSHVVPFKASASLPAGLYYLILRTEYGQKISKIILAK